MRGIMCGRFTLSSSLLDIWGFFEVDNVIEFSSRYNIAPSQDVLVVRNNEKNKRELTTMHWGFIPWWFKEENIGSQWINARAETIEEKPLFKEAFKKRRCLIVADGFYEWQHHDKIKTPHYIHLNDGKPFGIAGLWERWKNNEGKIIESCALLTTEANKLLQPIHSRMPVILDRSNFSQWLDITNQNIHEIKALLKAGGLNSIESYPVSTLVNKPSNDTVQCIQPDTF
jgi:putative SOS response-associated peptidase YedK